MTTYREAGVDIDAADETVDRIRDDVRSTYTPEVLTDVGAFGGLYSLEDSTVERPVLVSSIDGVGTKLKVAVRAERYDTIGRDLVNHCVNDVAVSGARPLFFLDYFSTGELDPDTAAELVGGFAAACRKNECALVGGEIAEMPDLYDAGDFDVAGTVVGLVGREEIVDGSEIRAGDRLIGLPSNGLHTNGYTLARTVLFEKFSVEDPVPELDGRLLGEELLRVHRSYLGPIQHVFRLDGVNGFAHVTGGGIVENTGRILPEGLTAELDWDAWERPPIFDLIQELGTVPEADMRRTFNLGIGLVVVVRPDRTDSVLGRLAELEAGGIPVGRVRSEDS